MSKQKLSERLYKEAMSDSLVTLAHADMVYALEAENQRLKGEMDDYLNQSNRHPETRGLRKERDALRAEVETLRRERNVAVNDAAHEKGWRLDTRDFNRELKLERDTAIRERDEARADERLKRKANGLEWRRLALDVTIDERDAALAKLEKVREWADSAAYPDAGDIGEAHYGWEEAQEALLAILDVPAPERKEQLKNLIRMTEEAGGYPELSTQGDTEVVTREVVLWKWPEDHKDQRVYCHEQTPILSPFIELARATVTFHVKRETPKPPRVGESLRKAVRRE